VSLSDLSDPAAVERAIEEFDRIGRDAFLKKYGYGRSRSYELVRDGKRYDVKAIVGAAHGYQLPHEGPLRNDQFTSGARSTVPKLESLGFEVARSGAPKPAAAKSAFLFNANPSYYDIDGAVRSLAEMNWSVKQNRRQIHAGDRVYVWKSGPERGVVAVGTILTDPEMLPEQEGSEFIRDGRKFDGEQLRVRLSIDRVLDPPLAGSEMRPHPVLSQMRIFKVANNTNYRLSEDEDAALQALIQGGDGEQASLADRLAQWLEETGYPNAIDRRRNSERPELAQGLAQVNLLAAVEDPNNSWNPLLFEQLAHKAYGDPGNQSTVNRQLRDDPEAKPRIAAALHHLLYGPGDDVKRLGEVLDEPALRVPGLSESLTTKALAVVRPERWLPLYQYSGTMGKLGLMASPELALEVPADLEQWPLAQRIAYTNDALREKVEPLLRGDPWGQMVFLYWLRDQHRRRAAAEPGAAGDPAPSPDLPRLPPYSEPTLEEIADRVAAAGLAIDERTLRRYHVSLRTRGFVILSGLSGTGKTWLAERYAEAVDAKHLRVPVAPNWTSNEDLLGYQNAIEERFQPTELTRFVEQAVAAWQQAEEEGQEAWPFHVTLDEMNLARVEYYFARFLSAMEVRARGGEARIELGPGREIPLPPNLRFSGTVNVDETTHGFADKVIDRAQLIELDAPREELERRIGDAPYAGILLEMWDAVHTVAPFAFRVVDEVADYVERSEELREGWEEPLDEQLLQKVLPKLRGANPAIGSSLRDLLEICDGNLPLTEAKARIMREHFEQHGFSTYFF
jgi:MoxR-like ATPase